MLFPEYDLTTMKLRGHVSHSPEFAAFLLATRRPLVLPSLMLGHFLSILVFFIILQTDILLCAAVPPYEMHSKQPFSHRHIFPCKAFKHSRNSVLPFALTQHTLIIYFYLGLGP